MISYLAGASAASPILAARYSVFGHRIDLSAQPILALLAGLLILFRPKLLNFIVAIYLILIGVIGMFRLFR